MEQPDILQPWIRSFLLPTADELTTVDWIVTGVCLLSPVWAFFVGRTYESYLFPNVALFFEPEKPGATKLSPLWRVVQAGIGALCIALPFFAIFDFSSIFVLSFDDQRGFLTGFFFGDENQKQALLFLPLQWMELCMYGLPAYILSMRLIQLWAECYELEPVYRAAVTIAFCYLGIFIVCVLLPDGTLGAEFSTMLSALAAVAIFVVSIGNPFYLAIGGSLSTSYLIAIGPAYHTGLDDIIVPWMLTGFALQSFVLGLYSGANKPGQPDLHRLRMGY